MNASRLAVTAAFAMRLRNFPTSPRREHVEANVAVYHALPHGLCDGLRRRVWPDQYVDITSVIDRKRQMLAHVPLSAAAINPEVLQAPHNPPNALPSGKMAVYIFSWADRCLKVGKAGPKSQARMDATEKRHCNKAPLALLVAVRMRSTVKSAFLRHGDTTSLEVVGYEPYSNLFTPFKAE